MTDLQTRLRRYGHQVPRYTSYPPAPQFSRSVDARTYEAWLTATRGVGPASLYLHVPFCDALCLYCGCNTAIIRHDAIKRAYADHLAREIDRVAARTGRLKVTDIHWGGGTPSALPADCLVTLTRRIGQVFDTGALSEMAAEIDPRHLPPAHLDAFAAIGLTRASLGVQDLDPAVQQIIGRVQDFPMIRDCVTRLRGIGVRSINLDLIYGLPGQTTQSVIRTANQILSLAPDRVAVFGYAHVPWMKRHQALLDSSALPDPQARLDQSAAIAEILIGAAYRRIGLDHYALPHDRLCRAAEDGKLRRNFQGYTAEPAAMILAFGASAISALPDGYAQNAASVRDYEAAIEAGGLATCRGIALSAEDRVRAAIIQDVMCFGEAELGDHDFKPTGPIAETLRIMADDDLITLEGSRLRVTEGGRPFLRNVAAAFDAYRDSADGRHALAV